MFTGERIFIAVEKISASFYFSKSLNISLAEA